MKSGIQNCVVQTLPVEELKDFMPTKELKERPEDSFAKYAKQREFLANLDKRLDYHNIQKAKHPHLGDLRAFMQRNKSTGGAHSNSRHSNPFEDTSRFETSAMAAQKAVTTT